MVMCINTNSIFFTEYQPVTIMDRTSSVDNSSDMEEDEKPNFLPYQWIQQSTTSVIIKLEPETTYEQPGK